jgi:hypothetical protein
MRSSMIVYQQSPVRFSLYWLAGFLTVPAAILCLVLVSGGCMAVAGDLEVSRGQVILAGLLTACFLNGVHGFVEGMFWSAHRAAGPDARPLYLAELWQPYRTGFEAQARCAAVITGIAIVVGVLYLIGVAIVHMLA